MLRRLDVPTLIFVGDRDAMYPLDLMISLYRALPNAELAACPNADRSGWKCFAHPPEHCP